MWSISGPCVWSKLLKNRFKIVPGGDAPRVDQRTVEWCLADQQSVVIHGDAVEALTSYGGCLVHPDMQINLFGGQMIRLHGLDDGFDIAVKAEEDVVEEAQRVPACIDKGHAEPIQNALHEGRQFKADDKRTFDMGGEGRNGCGIWNGIVDFRPTCRVDRESHRLVNRVAVERPCLIPFEKRDRQPCRGSQLRAEKRQEKLRIGPEACAGLSFAGHAQQVGADQDTFQFHIVFRSLCAMAITFARIYVSERVLDRSHRRPFRHGGAFVAAQPDLSTC
jgi:hypothetical protein